MIRCGCGRRVPIEASRYVGTMVFDDCTLCLFNCDCGSSRAVCLWRNESFDDEEAEPTAAE